VVGETQQLRPLPAIDDIVAPAGAIGSSLVFVSDMQTIFGYKDWRLAGAQQKNRTQL
jgi:hypothetical protein